MEPCHHAQMSLRDALSFLREVDKLKSVLRRTRLTFDPARCENDAEHSWHLAIMAVVLTRHAAERVDLLQVLRMILVHDLVEIDAGDTFLYDDAMIATQEARERAAADRIFGLLPEPQRHELRVAWEEFEARITPEARFARALDRAQPMLQNLYTEGASWRAHDIAASEVRRRNGPLVRDGAPELWVVLDAMLDEAVTHGWLRAERSPDA
jgi:putative hydrolase of HD superfamily